MRLEAEANHSSEKERMREPRGAEMRSEVEGSVCGFLSCLGFGVRRVELLIGMYVRTCILRLEGRIDLLSRNGASRRHCE